MNIQGFQKLTLLDFPGKMACTVFTAGCNLRCPFCHNSSLVIDPSRDEYISQEEFFSFLVKRKGILEGVAITGGEPLLQADIIEFITKIKEFGYAVKLDTNGTFPDKLKSIVRDGLVDYVAMDIKASPEAYPQSVGIGTFKTEKISESIAFLLEGNVDYEFRTTVTNELLSFDDIDKLGQWIKGADKHFLQAFKDSGDLIGFGLTPVSKQDMNRMRDIMLKYVKNCELRGI